MIPTMILVGLLVGLLPRPWYLVGTLVASVGWAVLLVSTDVIGTGETSAILGALLLGFANVIVGVGVTKAVATLLCTFARQT